MNHLRVTMFFALLVLSVMEIFPQNVSFKDSVERFLVKFNQLPDSVKLDSLHSFAIQVKPWRIYGDVSASLFSDIDVRELYRYYFQELSRNCIGLYLDIAAIKRHQRVFEPTIDEEYYEDFISLKRGKPLRRFRKTMHGGSWDRNISDIDYFREHNLKDTATLLLWTGLKYYDHENHKKATQFFQQAIDAATLHHDLPALKTSLSYQSALQYQMGEYNQALASASRALQVSKAINDSVSVASGLNNLGEIYYKLNMFNESKEMFYQSLMAYQNLSENGRVPLQWVKMGKAKISLGEFEDARKALESAIHLGKTHDNPQTIRDAYFYSGLLAERQGRISDALGKYLAFNRIKDSLFAEELDGFINEREDYWQSLLGREISKKEFHGLLSKQANIQLDRTKTIALILILMTALLLLLFGLGYRIYISNRRANRYLNELNATRNKFFSIISHDLRGPLTGFIQLLTPIQKKADNLTSEQIIGYTAVLNELAGKTLFLLDNLLKWAKLQRGYLKANPTKVLLNELVELNINLYKPIAVTKKIKFEFDSNENFFVFADSNMIDTVIRNLINNAIKFSFENDSIFITIHRKFTDIILEIADNGMGIDPDEFFQIFSCELGTKSIKGKPEKGSGIGLPLSKEFVEKNGGKIWVESPGLGKGSTFSFSIPEFVNQSLS